MGTLWRMICQNISEARHNWLVTFALESWYQCTEWVHLLYGGQQGVWGRWHLWKTEKNLLRKTRHLWKTARESLHDTSVEPVNYWNTCREHWDTPSRHQPLLEDREITEGCIIWARTSRYSRKTVRQIEDSKMPILARLLRDIKIILEDSKKTCMEDSDTTSGG